VINKTDLAPYVGASLEVMASDTQRMRGDRPWTFTNLKQGDGLSTIIAFRRQRHARQIGLLHQPGASASGWCNPPALSLYHPASTSAPRLPCKA
jgi:hypothetical protein